MKKIIVLIVAISIFEISFSQSRLININTANLSLILKQEDNNKLTFQYFGKKLIGESALLEKNCKLLGSLYQLDNEAYPAFGAQVIRESALKVIHFDGNQTTELNVVDVLEENVDKNIKRTTIKMKDDFYDFFVDIIYNAYQTENVITQEVKILNLEKNDITLENFYSSYLPIFSDQYYLTSFSGSWGAEMQVNETNLTSGTKVIESVKGIRTTLSENPSFLLSLNHPAQPDNGEVIIGALAWSGNYKINFEIEENKQLNISAGINPFASSYSLAYKQSFTTPQMIWSYSNTGYGQASRNMHDWARNYALHAGQKSNAIVLNNWEGIGFNFNESVIQKMIDNASKLGVEVFVLDDGWFGNKFPRDNDKAGLGDWQENIKKLPHGLKGLADYAASKGLRFGIWIEPEMVNPQSELAISKPNWIVKSKNREMPTMRNQLVLDLSNPDVQDFVFNTFKDIVSKSPNISYVKWDSNRHINNFGSEYLSTKNQSHFWIDYINGLYSVYQRIRKEFPNIEIQDCSSGGGRLDYGALKYHDEFWTSDDTDPFERIFIQYGTSLIYPVEAMSAHVTSSPNHNTGNTSSIKFRFDVSMTGRLGLELQPSNLTQSELEFSKKAIEVYKGVRDIVQLGDLYPIISPYQKGGWSSQVYVTKNKKRALFFAFSLEYHQRLLINNFRLQGLDPEKQYKVTEINKNENSNFWGDGKIFTGDYLMKVGVNTNISKRGESVVLLLDEKI
jgi:alpha-galactosidase